MANKKLQLHLVILNANLTGVMLIGHIVNVMSVKKMSGHYLFSYYTKFPFSKTNVVLLI